MTNQPTRHVIVVDVETSGLDLAEDITVEIAWRDLDSGEGGCFVPIHSPSWVLQFGNPEALDLNGYRERLAEAPQDESGAECARLAAALEGQTLAGSNPAFDSGFLSDVFAMYTNVTAPRWHHRLADLSAYAAGVLGLPLGELPGLATVCELLGVVNAAPHTAEGDVAATAECFRRLQEMNAR